MQSLVFPTCDICFIVHFRVDLNGTWRDVVLFHVTAGSMPGIGKCFDEYENNEQVSLLECHSS